MCLEKSEEIFSFFWKTCPVRAFLELINFYSPLKSSKNSMLSDDFRVNRSYLRFSDDFRRTEMN